MLNLQALKINPFVDRLSESYSMTFGVSEPEKLNLLRTISTIALENIANGDMLYHNVDHTIMVTSVGMQIIRGKHLYEGGFSDLDALNYLVGLLCHDVGYVKGACRQDDQKKCLFDDGEGGLVEIPATGTCALLSPHHVSRSKQFVNEHFVKNKLLDLKVITQCIERTRFPVPEDESYQATSDLPGLTRAADLIGQLGDPEYLRKIPALFYEFQELGQNQEMGYNSPGELRKGFAQFFWSVVRNYVEDAISLLQITQEGKEWISRLHSQVFECEHFA